VNKKLIKALTKIIAKTTVEIDPDMKIALEEVYLQNQNYRSFVASVAMHLRKFMVEFNLKEEEMIDLFAKNLIDKMWGKK
jgi:hypothetical protein